MYKVLFIDEEQETFDYFNDYVDHSSTKDVIEVITQYPLEDLDDMIQFILKTNPDAIITDFMLNDIKEDIKYNVPYNGVELMEKFLQIREAFPFFVLTSFDDLAVNESDDVNKIYIKNLLHNKEETKAKATFLDRVVCQIVNYKSKIDNYENELLRLIELRKEGNASIDIEKRIIELDDLLEKAIDRRSVIPIEFKELSNFKSLEQMLSKVDELINKVDKENGK
jgi:hypothetical protein